MLLPYLPAKHEHERTLSHELLAKLSGKDFGYDARILQGINDSSLAIYL
jgi:hypothetical protein